MGDVEPSQQGSERPGALLSGREQGQVGQTGVLAGLGPLGGAVADQDES